MKVLKPSITNQKLQIYLRKRSRPSADGKVRLRAKYRDKIRLSACFRVSYSLVR